MITAILLVLALLIGLPILVKLIEKFSARWMVKISELEGFWEFMSGKGITPPANPSAEYSHATKDSLLGGWKMGGSPIPEPKRPILDNQCPVTKSVKLTEDWELPTLERELAEEKRWGDGLLEGELEKN